MSGEQDELNRIEVQALVRRIGELDQKIDLMGDLIRQLIERLEDLETLAKK